MKPGQLVTIYEDPITQTKIEGKAKLVKFLKNYEYPMERWEVKFIDDGYITARFIQEVK